MASVKIDHLVKEFSSDGEQIVAVDDVNITIADGEFLVLVGPSGCGKSTTLRCLAGLETVTSGQLFLDDTDITNQKPKNRDIAMVFQEYALYPHFTARENMSLGLEMSTDMSSKTIRRKVTQVAEMMGIEDLLDQTPGELSGGQQQRVALGRAIVRDPEVFLMDEPLSNLDAKLRTQMRTELQDLQDDLGVSTIYVTHDQTEAMTMGDRIAILNEGKLQQIGTPMECYTRPKNKFVAGFIGSPSMNFVEITPDTKNGSCYLSNEQFRYEITEQLYDTLSSDVDYALGIRPEDVSLQVEKNPELFTAQISVVEPLGDRQICYFDLNGHSFTVTVGNNDEINEGDNVYIDISEESLHIFESESGRAISNGTSYRE